eukprot:TRINITY_DN637_c0_g1_i1.p3 TRINITY_DN637_c0_g1~~TRINITY_DN637_c0_g1_i1.p3  ORF type:complete len:203 (-),score=66.25 TRINITY_DN637_c0_g1_i1:32-640(-)
MADDADGAFVMKKLEFVSADDVAKERAEKGEVDDSEKRPLWEVLKENKDKADDDFEKKFKHVPQEALGEQDLEFFEECEEKKERARQTLESEVSKFHEAKEVLTVKDSFLRVDRSAASRPPTSILGSIAGTGDDDDKTNGARDNGARKKPEFRVRVKRKEGELLKTAGNVVKNATDEHSAKKARTSGGGLLGLADYGDDDSD